MNRYLPAPWRLDSHGQYIHSADGQTIAMNVSGRANGFMLTAAPEQHEALKKLAAEVRGLFKFEHELRQAIGNTNLACLTERLKEADAVIEKAEKGAN